MVQVMVVIVDVNRPYVYPNEPREDIDGVKWYACDPYPTWYRRENGKTIVGRLKFPKAKVSE